jgi:hypothetical protein
MALRRNHIGELTLSPDDVFGFRPWVRRAGASIVGVAAAITALVVLRLLTAPEARFGWFGEPFVWIYLATLWLGGLRIWLGTRSPVVEIGGDSVLVRPLHLFRGRRIAWVRITAIEQMVGGDRMILYFEDLRGPRQVALNLNLVRGRRAFVERIESILRQRGFRERIIGRSRVLSAWPDALEE